MIRSINRYAKIIAVPTVLLALSGCFGPSDTIKANTLNDFYTKAGEMYVSINGEMGPGAAESFSINLVKIGVYNAFDPSQVDLSKGLVEVDVASVLERDGYSQVTAAYSVVGQQASQGISVTEINNLARQMETSAIQNFQNHVDNYIYDLNLRKTKISAYLDNLSKNLQSVVLSGPSLIIENAGSFNSATLTAELINGSNAKVSRAILNVTVLDQTGNEIVSSDEEISFGRSLSIGEKKNFSLSVLSSEIVGLEPSKYNVRISVSSIETPEGKLSLI